MVALHHHRSWAASLRYWSNILTAEHCVYESRLPNFRPADNQNAKRVAIVVPLLHSYAGNQLQFILGERYTHQYSHTKI